MFEEQNNILLMTDIVCHKSGIKKTTYQQMQVQVRACALVITLSCMNYIKLTYFSSMFMFEITFPDPSIYVLDSLAFANNMLSLNRRSSFQQLFCHFEEKVPFLKKN